MLSENMGFFTGTENLVLLIQFTISLKQSEGNIKKTTNEKTAFFWLFRKEGKGIFTLGIKINNSIRFSEIYDHKGITCIKINEILKVLTDLIRQIAADIMRVAN